MNLAHILTLSKDVVSEESHVRVTLSAVLCGNSHGIVILCVVVVSKTALCNILVQLSIAVSV